MQKLLAENREEIPPLYVKRRDQPHGYASIEIDGDDGPRSVIVEAPYWITAPAEHSTHFGNQEGGDYAAEIEIGYPTVDGNPVELTPREYDELVEVATIEASQRRRWK